MLDILGRIATLRRPRLLVSAARFGLSDYSRAVHLPRLLQGRIPPRSGEALLRLLEIEDDQNDARMAKAATYSVAAHVETLIAILGEAQLYRASLAPPTLVT